MEKNIIKLQQKSLSNYDITKLCGDINVVTYQNLYKYETLDDLLGKNNACVILYQTNKNYGHWVAIIKINDNLVEHFDSYGIFPDDELNFVPDYLKKETNQDYRYMTRLLSESPYKLSYNEYKLQNRSSKIATCGRWVSCRIIMRHLPLSKFIKIFKDKKFTPDFIVTLLTCFI